MSSIKQSLLIIALGTCAAPSAAADRYERASALGAGIAGCALAGAVAYCAWQWYFAKPHWSVKSVTQEVETRLSELVPYLHAKIDWNGYDHFLPHRQHALARNHGRLRLTLRYDTCKKVWVVTGHEFITASPSMALHGAGQLLLQYDYPESPHANLIYKNRE